MPKYSCGCPNGVAQPPSYQVFLQMPKLPMAAQDYARMSNGTSTTEANSNPYILTQKRPRIVLGFWLGLRLGWQRKPTVSKTSLEMDATLVTKSLGEKLRCTMLTILVHGFSGDTVQKAWYIHSFLALKASRIVQGVWLAGASWAGCARSAARQAHRIARSL